MNASVAWGLRRGRLFGAAALILTVIFLIFPGGARAEWWLYPPAGYQGIGGASRIGPYKTWYDANNVNQEYFNGQGSIYGQNDPEPGYSGNQGGSSSTYGVVTIYNRTGAAISFSLQSAYGGGWISDTIAANGGWYYRYQPLPARFTFSFDNSYLPGTQNKRYSLDYDVFNGPGKPGHEDGRAYELYLKDDGETIGLRAAGSGGSYSPSPASSFYGVVTVYNRTGGDIPCSVQGGPGGRWLKETISAHGSRYFYQPLPAKFIFSFDNSYRDGVQTKRYSLKHNVFKGSGKPSFEDGRVYELYAKDDGDTIGLRVGMASGSADNTIGSIIGNGTGTADSAESPTSASGSFSVQAITPAGMELATGTWKATRKSSKTVGEPPLYSVENWTFTLQFDNREASVSTTFTVVGGAGTSAAFPIVFPCSRGPDQKIRIQFGVQFSGDQVRLLTFTRTD